MSGERDEKVLEESLLTDEIKEGNEELLKADNSLNLKRKLSTDNIAERFSSHKKHATQGNYVVVDQDDNIFPFIPQNSADLYVNERTEKTLDDSKPQKRKIENDIDEDLFKFLPNQNLTSANTTQENVEIKSLNNKEIGDKIFQTKRIKLDVLKDNSESISALRGTKLQDLKYDGIGWKSCPKIKKEDTYVDLERKISQIDLGTTIVTVRKYERIERNISFAGDLNMKQIMNSKVQNFKKFNKVWPLKIH